MDWLERSPECVASKSMLSSFAVYRRSRWGPEAPCWWCWSGRPACPCRLPPPATPCCPPRPRPAGRSQWCWARPHTSDQINVHGTLSVTHRPPVIYCPVCPPSHWRGRSPAWCSWWPCAVCRPRAPAAGTLSCSGRRWGGQCRQCLPLLLPTMWWHSIEKMAKIPFLKSVF